MAEMAGGRHRCDRWLLVVTFSLSAPDFVCGQPGGAVDAWEVSSQNSCQGAMTESGSCPSLPPCGGCIKVDCAWGTWSEWINGGGCTGICIRQRNTSVENTECGKPCSGKKSETKTCLTGGCVQVRQDCALSEWSQWSDANCHIPTEQKYRQRHVLVAPAHGGDTCPHDMRETAPCVESKSAIDCKFNSWERWTTCTKTCSGGRKTRQRTVAKDASNGGKPCDGVLENTIPCHMHACSDATACILGTWAAWSGCNTQTPNQKFRKREVASPASKGGTACIGPMKETAGCSQHPVECKISDWSSWAACDQACDGGQKLRTRSLVAPATKGGKCPQTTLRETVPCGTQPCSTPGPHDCQMSTWELWSACSARCGDGLKTRSRSVLSVASGGKGCRGSLEEVSECEDHQCAKVDCEWDVWAAWSACSCTCGGGTMRRTRVVKTAPENGGEDCKAQNKAEVAPCNLQGCTKHCVDGRWNDWSPWSQCSATCDAGFKARRRDIMQQPNVCGTPAGGVGEEYMKCNAAQASCVQHRDCLLAEWGQWSACSCTCFGVRERHRVISQFRNGNGRPCIDQSLKNVEPCSPGIGLNAPSGCEELAPIRDCRVDTWTPWSTCSASCGGGQKSRSRHILIPPSGGGVPCTANLAGTMACRSQACASANCLDCTWGQWSMWGGCTKCGGQRWRHRSVEQLPNYCGQRCDPRSAKEVGECTSFCNPPLYCAWSSWSTYPSCPMQCGSATTARHRTLGLHQNNNTIGDYLFISSGSVTCTGTQTEINACKDQTRCQDKCQPRNCQFATWGEWGSPACNGLCERQRIVAQTNNECGLPCSGPLIETRRCEPDCVKPQDCVLGEWGIWGNCNSAEAQRYRARGVKQVPSNGGEPCRGPLRETASCNDPVNPPVDCQVSEWSSWGACTRPCGAGYHTRNRRMNVPASRGGNPCTESLEEVVECNSHACIGGFASPCLMGQWLAWSGCQSNGQTLRGRSIVRYAEGSGKGCHEDIEQTMACDKMDINCRISAWTMWGVCDTTCGGAQRIRQRQVDNYPHLGGKDCEPDLSLVETGSCPHQIRCAPINDCSVNFWTAWSVCSASCGVGQHTRSRNVTQLRQTLDGVGCNDALSETKTCKLQACLRRDCLWGLWQEWSTCSRSCGGGEQVRNRNIVQAPTQGGRPCVVQHKAEIQACNLDKCLSSSCIDGQWSDWANWESCTRTCGGGMTWRSRVVRQAASSCGKTPVGLSQEAGTCNKDVPCQADVNCILSVWASWSTCSATCFGSKSRARTIMTHGVGRGAFCTGALNEIAPCSPGQSEVAPLGCPTAGQSVDCVLGSWLQWAACTVTCGGGQRTRERVISVQSQSGGSGCRGNLRETGDCKPSQCPQIGQNKVDCKWGEWASWGACDRCGGQRKRNRRVVATPRNGGGNCQQEASEETEACPRHCHAQYFCAWAVWEEWDACTATCGHGKRNRRRHLDMQVSSTVPAARLWEEQQHAASESTHEADVSEEDSLHALYRHEKHVEESHFLEMTMAFGCGCMSLLVGLLASRVCSRSLPRHSRSEHSQHLRAEPSEGEAEE